MLVMGGLALGAGIIAPLWGTHWISLSGGEIIQAERTWVVFDQVFYEKGAGTLFTVNTDSVDEILRADFSSFHDWKVILSHAAASGLGVFSILKQWQAWVFFFGVLVAFPLVRGLVSLISKNSHESKNDEDFMDLISVPIPPQASNTEKVVLFFLTIFLVQINARKKDKYQYQPTDIKGPFNTLIYEFRAHVDGQWQTRRISLGRIGEDSGARSTCFYVIYDGHFVVKILPELLTDIPEYIQAIRADQRIAQLLAPRTCLVPRVSMILNRIPAFLKTIGKTVGATEHECMEGLLRYPEFQNFLKIGAGFGFFIDFSQHFFLAQILSDCHNTGPEIAKEIDQHRNLIWSPSEFADRYGEEFTDLCFDLQKGFQHFDSLLKDSDISLSRKKIWYTAMLLGNEMAGDVKKIPEKARGLFKDVKKEHGKAVGAYLFLIETYTREIFFKRNIAKLKNIASRLLDLLSWLYSKQIAIRDLKPDNLMVTGDPSNYPQFLNSPDSFELGLIDVETAVRLTFANTVPDQPKLGWTPFYATPAHMFTNEVLGRLYEDLRHVYFLQDWHATVAMIFQTITGKKLFVKTAGVLAGFSKSLPRYFDDQAQMTVFARNATAKFWLAASDEFDARMQANKGILMAAPLEITRNARKMFRAAAEKSRDHDLEIQLSEIASSITTYDGLKMMFQHVREIMTPMP